MLSVDPKSKPPRVRALGFQPPTYTSILNMRTSIGASEVLGRLQLSSSPALVLRLRARLRCTYAGRKAKVPALGRAVTRTRKSFLRHLCWYAPSWNMQSHIFVAGAIMQRDEVGTRLKVVLRSWFLSTLSSVARAGV